MFKSIRVKNFKAYKDSGNIALKPLTILVGPNNSGKSSILHALLMLKQTLKEAPQEIALATSGQFVDLNGFYDISHGKDQEGGAVSVLIGLRNPITVKYRSSGQDFKSKEIVENIEISFSFSKIEDEIKVEYCRLHSRDFKIEVSKGGKEWSMGKYTSKFTNKLKLRFENFLPVIHPGDLSKGIFPRSLGDILNVSRLANHMWKDVFRRLNRIDPLRERIPWHSAAGVRSAIDFGGGGENLLGALSNRSDAGNSGKSLLDLTDDWISRRLKVLDKLRIEKLDKEGRMRSLLGDEVDGIKNINVAAMGEGVSQILPIISRTINCGEDECLLVEQPEIHLHPKLQTQLGDLFLETALTGNRQIIVETHSEHLILRIRRRLAEGKTVSGVAIKPSDIAILFVEKDEKGSSIREIEMNEKGHFVDWPKGFFDEAYQEAMQLTKAGFKKD